jgi:branched-chain amino acid transport system ATP-binding protein
MSVKNDNTTRALAVERARVAFSGVTALDDVDLTVRAGEIVGLIGPNGAGKTTLVNVLSGYQRQVAGRLLLEGQDVTGKAPHVLARRGLARTFQGVRPFVGLSVAENVEVGALGQGVSRRSAQETTWRVLEQVGLADRAQRPAGGLPYGDQRRLALARALATEPTFLLLDEPAAGLDEEETAAMAALIRTFATEQELGLLVIEHDMTLIRNLCDRVQVLAQGATIFEGPPSALSADKRVQEAYLGETEMVEHAAG